MERLAAMHAVQAFDLILISGDMTDAGTSAEWAEFASSLFGVASNDKSTFSTPVSQFG